MAECEHSEENPKDWSTRFYEVINEMPLDEDKLLELLKEDWTMSEYRDAVDGMGSPGVVLDDSPLHDGWKRMELVHCHIISYLKTGQLDPDHY